MIKKILFFFFFSTQLWAASWPENMYTVEKIFNEQFSTLRSYIQNLKINYPYKVFSQKIVFYEDNGVEYKEIFRLQMRILNEKGYIKQTILFISPENKQEKFVYERWGEDKQGMRPYSLLEFTAFDFYFPQNIDRLRLEFQQQKVYQEVVFSALNVKSHYRLYDYSSDVFHQERVLEHQLYSKLWYQCSSCTGEPLVVSMDTRAGYMGNMSYYFGIPLEFVTPKAFFTKANRFYLSGIFHAFKSIPDTGGMNYGWPSN